MGIEVLKDKENDRKKKTTYFVTRMLTGSRGEEGNLCKRINFVRRNCFYGWLTDKFANQGALGPETTGLVEERRDLSGEPAVPSRGTKDDTVGLNKVVGGNDRVLGLQRRASVHL